MGREVAMGEAIRGLSRAQGEVWRRPRFLALVLSLPLLGLLLADRPAGSSPVLAPVVASGAALSPEALPVEEVVGACSPVDESGGRWQFLSDLPWSAAI